MVLGRDLGPAIDIGPAMTRKILKPNGKVVYRSMVQSLTPDEVADSTARDERVKFTASVTKALGEGLASDPERSIHLFYDRYDDDVDGYVSEALDNEPDGRDTLDQFVGAEVLLPIGGKVMNAKVRGRKRLLVCQCKSHPQHSHVRGRVP